MIPNGPGSPATSTELKLRWRSSRHTRRLLTLGLTGLFIAVLARRPEFAGLAVHGPRNAVDKIFKGASLHP